MNNFSSETENNHRTTSGSIAGGCFLYNIPPLLFVVFAAFFIVFFGKKSEISPEKSVSLIQYQNKQESEIASFFMPEVLYWENNILEWADEWSLDPNLIATVMQIESCGNPLAESYAGAMGLFQVMPYHFSETEKPFEPLTNARRGLGYLRKAQDTYQSIRLALAGYNGGITTAGREESQWPAETLRYVYWGENIYMEAKEGLERSPTLDEWLSAGGASLCSQAQKVLPIN